MIDNVSIFNRWGDKVWEAKNYDNDKVIWKGQHLPGGTYYYVIELLPESGIKRYSGWVVVTD